MNFLLCVLIKDFVLFLIPSGQKQKLSNPMSPTAKDTAAKYQNRTPSVYCQSGSSEPEQTYQSSRCFQTSSSSFDETGLSRAIDTVCESSASPTGDFASEYSSEVSLAKENSPKGDFSEGDFPKEDFPKEAPPERFFSNKYQNPNIITPPENLTLFGYKSTPPRSYDFKLITAECPRPASPFESSSENFNTGSQTIDSSIFEPNPQEYPVLLSESTIWERILSSQDPQPLFTRPIQTSEQGKEEGVSRKRLRRKPSTSILPSCETGLSDVIDETDALESDTDTDVSDYDDTNPSADPDSPKGYRISTESVFAIPNASSRHTLTPNRSLTERQSQISEESKNDTSITLIIIPSRPDIDEAATHENHASSLNTPAEIFPPQPLDQEELAYPPQPLDQEELAYPPQPLEQELAYPPQPLEQELAYPPQPLEEEQLAYSPQPLEQEELAYFAQPLEQELAFYPQPFEQVELTYPTNRGAFTQFSPNYDPCFQDNHGDGFAEADNVLNSNVDADGPHHNDFFQPPRIPHQNNLNLSIVPVLKSQQYQTNENIHQQDETELKEDIQLLDETDPDKGVDYSGFKFPMTTVSTPYRQNIARVPGYDPDSHKDIRIELFPTQSLCQITRRRFVRHNISVLQGHDPRFKYEINKKFSESKPYEYEFVRTNFFPGTQELDTKTRAASCAYCEELHFYKLKNSCYLFHMAYIHGISFRNYLYPDGVEAGIYMVPKAKISDDMSKPTSEPRSCVLCPNCFQVFATHTSKATELRAPLAKYQRHFKTVHQKTGGHNEFYKECVWYPSGPD